MNVMSPPFYGKGGYSAQDTLLLWEAVQVLQEGMRDPNGDRRRLLDLARCLEGVVESTREMYNKTLVERDEAYRRLQDADARLQQVEHVVRRYAEVKDPVVASDGYTYERTELSRYLSDCKKSSSKAYSQQTKEELTDVMVDNVSLRRLAELLKGVHTVEVPPLSNRVPLGGDTMRPRGHWAEEEVMTGGMAPIDAAAGTQGPIGGAPGGRGGNNHNIPLPACHGGNRRFDHAGKGGKAAGANEGKGGLHPCLRVYGFCNFADDCTFANYPYEACLNHIKGKCRFGSTCKELHVDPRDPVYHNARSSANNPHHGPNTSTAAANAAAADLSDSQTATPAANTEPTPAKAESAKAPVAAGAAKGEPAAAEMTATAEAADKSDKAEEGSVPARADSAEPKEETQE